MATQVKTFRIFVSSTFSDLIEERNALQEKVFPRLRELCQVHGTRFQAIDLRWGVSEEASLDQQTMNICLGEIARCQQVTPRPNFIILLGERYGWCPPPPQIPADEFEALLKHIPDPQDRSLLLEWYRRDDNAVPPEYCLQPRQRGSEYEQYVPWVPVERRLVDAMERAAQEVELDEDQRLKYTASATHQEIANGALQVEDAHEHVFCFFREIGGLPQDGRAAGYLDIDETGDVDQQSHDKLLRLKGELRQRLPGNVSDYRATWKGDRITTDHLEGLCQDVYDRLAGVILAEISQMETVDPLQAEIDAHTAFGDDRARHFVGRAKVLKAIDEYLNGEDAQPLVIWGVSGSGKSALMAKAVQQTQARYPEAQVIYRFIGATPESINNHKLLESLCHQIYKHFEFEKQKQKQINEADVEFEEKIKQVENSKQPMTEDISTPVSPLLKGKKIQRLNVQRLTEIQSPRQIEKKRQQIILDYSVPNDYYELSAAFQRFLNYVPDGEKLIIYLDALDQLSDADPDHGLIWVPEKLPQNIRMVISTLSDGRKSLLDARLPDSKGIELESLSVSEARQMLDIYLADANRTLQKGQKKEILIKFSGCPHPLYLKLAIEEARRWKSFEGESTVRAGLSKQILGIVRDKTRHLKRVRLESRKPDDEHSKKIDQGYILAENIAGMIRKLFNRLSDEINHGELLVSRSLGYLAASKNGLSEDEFIDLLSRDEKVMADFFRRSPRSPKVDRLPVVVWSRLYFDLEPYLMERTADGLTLLSFYHRQIAETAEDVFVSGGEKAKRHQELAEYFDTQQVYQESEGQKTINLRKLSEFPYHQAHANLLDDVQRTLTNFEFLQAKVEGAGLQLLIDDFIEVAKAGFISKSLSLIQHALNLSAHAIHKNPFELAGQLTGRLSGFNIPEIENLLYLMKTWRHPWIRPLTPMLSTPGGPLLRSLSGHNDCITSVLITPDNRLVISACDDMTIKVWNIETGIELHTLSGLYDYFRDFVITPDGHKVIASYDKNLKVWNIDLGSELYKLRHTSELAGVMVTPDSRKLISWSFDDLIVWELDSGLEVVTISEDNNIESWHGIVTDRDGRQAISYYFDGTLKMWDLITGSEVVTLIGHNAGVCCAVITPDGRYAVSAYYDKTISVWDLNTGEDLALLTGHTSTIEILAVTPDGRLIVSASNDMTIKVWDFESKIELATLIGHTKKIKNLLVSPDSRCVVSTSDDMTLRVWNLERGVGLFKIRGRYDIKRCIAITPDGNLAVIASGKNIHIWDIYEGVEVAIFRGHTGNISSVGITSDGQHVVTGSYDNTLKVWDMNAIADQIIVSDQGHDQAVRCVVVTPDGKRAVSASDDGTLKVWDLYSRTELHTLVGHRGPINYVVVTSDGGQAISASEDNTLKLWDLDRGIELTTLEGHTDLITNLVVSPDGSRAVSTSRDQSLRIWDLNTVMEMVKLTGRYTIASNITSTPNGSQAVFTSGKKLEVWDLDSAESIYLLEGHMGRITDVVVAPDFRRAVSASEDNQLKVWNLITGTEIATLTGHVDRINDIVIIPDGSKAVSASEDMTLKIWDLEKGSELNTLITHNMEIPKRVYLASDGFRMISSSEKELSLWDIEEGIELATINCQPSNIIISKDGGYVFFKSSEQRIEVWNLVSGVELATFTGEWSKFLFTISPDNTTIVGGGEDGQVHILRLENGEKLDFEYTAFKDSNVIQNGVREYGKERISRKRIEITEHAQDLSLRARELKWRGWTRKALILHREAERIYREIDDQVGLQDSIGNQGLIQKKLNELESALALFKEQERICREINHLDGLYVSLKNQISILQSKGDSAGSKVLIEELEQIQRQLNDEDNS